MRIAIDAAAKLKGGVTMLVAGDKETYIGALLLYISRAITHHRWGLCLLDRPCTNHGVKWSTAMRARTNKVGKQTIGKAMANETEPWLGSIILWAFVITMPFLGSCQYINVIHWPHLLPAKCSQTYMYTHKAAIAKTAMFCSFPLPYSQFPKAKGHKYYTI